MKSIVVKKNGKAERHPIWLQIASFLAMRSANTRVTYTGVIREWCDYLGCEMGSDKAARAILSATPINAAAYKLYLQKRLGQRPRYRGSSPTTPTKALTTGKIKNNKQNRADGYQITQSNATIRKKFSALRRIYKAIIAHSEIPLKNPFDVDLVPPPPANSGLKRPTEMIDFALVKKIVQAPNLKLPYGLRDQALLAVLFGGGLRRSEAANLRLADIRNSPSGLLYLTLRATKAGRDANQTLPAWSAAIVRDLISQRLDQGAKPGDYLFVSYRGRGAKNWSNLPISESGIYKLFKKYCLMVGEKEFVSPHSARATAITKLLTDGLSHREVLEFSRHSSVQMVEVYDKRRFGVDNSPARKLDY
ncbi:MAG TPA: site-specific integrase [Oligoflexia bacterium]|nr:site-specific integrase [Oligoflexia bacterium]HMP27505.1 site-specific integrase [Oligoflexia bacterium]